MTAAIKDELSRLPVGSACCRRAEVSVVLRFAGGVYLAAGRVQVQAELDNALVARRLRREIGELFGDPAAAAGRPAKLWRVEEVELAVADGAAMDPARLGAALPAE